MRIPSGDLSPARRRRYGGTYGRRRRRTVRTLLVLVLLLVVAGGATYLLRRDDTAAPSRRQATAQLTTPATSCATPSAPQAPAAPVVLPPPTAVRLVLLNGTPRNGLGATVGGELAARGFTVAGTGNAPRPQVGPTSIVVGPNAQPAAMLLSRTFLDATVTTDAKAAPGSVQVVLGSAYTRLRTPAEVAALGATAPAPTRSAAACR